ncbi:MAG: phosphatidylglycerophosphatase A [Candidatus Aminicenantes bacterium]|nr:MAG: phosphatidylglycerophosphatase A [Candidatus Aminicenantes bacterium]
MKSLSKIIATFFGVGYFPVAPGTLTSLIVVLLYKFYLHSLSWPFYLLLLFLLFLVAIFTSTKYSLEIKKHDPRRIVIDEAFGQLLVLFQIGESWGTGWLPLLSCFLLFRIFDIIKPFPIKKVETLPEGWGIVMDDLVAAVYAGVIINLYLLLKFYFL